MTRKPRKKDYENKFKKYGMKVKDNGTENSRRDYIKKNNNNQAWKAVQLDNTLKDAT